MENVAFIINPHSAKKNHSHFLKQLKSKIKNPNYVVSKSIEETNLFIDENFNKTDVFIAVGGDGTISSVAEKIINTDKILGIFPSGSGNGFANETQFNKNLDQLIEKIKHKKTKKIDTFTVNNIISINVSGTGFDGKVVKEFEKTSRGFRNYIKVSIKTFFKYKPIKLSFITEEFKQYNGAYLMLNIANTRQFGNKAYIAPNASNADGFVDVVLVKKFPWYYSALFAYKMFAKTLKNNQYVTYLKVKEIEFSVSTKNWHIDGDFYKIPSPIKVEVMPKSLNILV